jgi:hypothetical protein
VRHWPQISLQPAQAEPGDGDPNHKVIVNLLVALFLETYATAPQNITLDLADDPLLGHYGSTVVQRYCHCY